MTSKDYEIIAGVLKFAKDRADYWEKVGTTVEDYMPPIYSTIRDMVEALEHDNPYFNRSTFLKACGL